jgi:hypothetical protein
VTEDDVTDDEALLLAGSAIEDDARATPGPWFTTADTCLVYTEADIKSQKNSQIADAFDNTTWSDAQCLVNARAIAAARTREPIIARKLIAMVGDRDSLQAKLAAMTAARDRACLLARAGYSTLKGWGWSDETRADADQQIRALEDVGKELVE